MTNEATAPAPQAAQPLRNASVPIAGTQKLKGWDARQVLRQRQQSIKERERAMKKEKEDEAERKRTIRREREQKAREKERLQLMAAKVRSLANTR